MPGYQTPIRRVASYVSTFDTGAARRGRPRRGRMTDAFVETSTLAGSVECGLTTLRRPLPGFVPFVSGSAVGHMAAWQNKNKGGKSENGEGGKRE